MQLITSRFGSVEFQPAELLVFEQGLSDYPQDRQWLLLADSCHESLYWLQSISNSSVAIPVVEFGETQPKRIDAETNQILRVRVGVEVLFLAPIRVEGDEVSIDSHLPIVINAKLGRCRQLRNERHQSDQQTMALMSAGLRQSA
jgi:flagellar assembly factor FliW